MRFMDGWATDITYSPDESGWWAEAIGAKGEQVYQTELHKRQQDAINELGQFTETHKAPRYKK